VISLGKELPVFDYLIVGAGFAGAVVSERMARCFGKKVLVVDRRNHIGGNAFDHYNDDSVLVHRYGPHIFHTNSEQVFQYLSQFTSWRPYEHRVLASVDGKLVPVPINLNTVNLLYGLNLTSEQLEAFFAARAESRPSIRTSEDVVVSKVGRDLYEKLFRNYTRKQWGRDPSELDAQVTARIPVRTNRDDRYFTDRFQVMPKNGYTRMFENMLDHPNITLALGVDYREVVNETQFRELVYSGPIDEFFGFRFGELPYRSLRFQHETLNTDYLQPVAVINYPNDHAYTRITEFKHLTGQVNRRTSIVYEYPASEGDPYYPVPTPENAALYKRYAELASSTKRVHFVGRLGTYRYYNMDQVVAQALTLCKQLAAAPEFQLTKTAAAAAVGQGLPAVPALGL
jgi:UDP-galactopyranose mutase